MSAGTPRPCMRVAEWSPPAWRSSRSSCGGALDAVGLEDESSDGGGGVATALPGRRCSALSESLWQRAGAEGAAAAAGTPPVRMMSSHGLALSNSLRFLLVVSCASF